MFLALCLWREWFPTRLAQEIIHSKLSSYSFPLQSEGQAKVKKHCPFILEAECAIIKTVSRRNVQYSTPKPSPLLKFDMNGILVNIFYFYSFKNYLAVCKYYSVLNQSQCICYRSNL